MRGKGRGGEKGKRERKRKGEEGKDPPLLFGQIEPCLWDIARQSQQQLGPSCQAFFSFWGRNLNLLIGYAQISAIVSEYSWSFEPQVLSRGFSATCLRNSHIGNPVVKVQN